MGSEEEWHGEMAKAKRLRFFSPVAGLVALGALAVPAVFAGKSVGSGFISSLVTAGALVALTLPLVCVLVIISDRQQNKADEKVRTLMNQQRFENRLANALDMAEGEPEVIDVIERSFAAVVPDSPVEFLLADNSRAHLVRMAAAGPDGEHPRAASSPRTAALPSGGPRCRCSATATISMRAPSCATGRRAGSRRCASRCPSWGGRWA